MYTRMRFVWDEAKNKLNFLKHKVSFQTALLIFDDPFAISILERIVDDEERWQTIGSAQGVTILLVAHTFREEEGSEILRIISARKATARERSIYEGKIKRRTE